MVRLVDQSDEEGASQACPSSCELTSQGGDSCLSGGVREGHRSTRGQSVTLMGFCHMETGVEVTGHPQGYIDTVCAYSMKENAS